MSRRMKRAEDGVSLIEVVVAVLVLSIGIIAGFQSLGQARRGIGAELPRLAAHQVALNRASELQMFGAGAPLPEQVTMAGIVWDVEAERASTVSGVVEVRVRVSAAGQPGAIYTVYAPPGPPQ